MEFVEPEDEPGVFRSPIHPDDRLWRHPSEVAAGPDGAIYGAEGGASGERPGSRGASRSTVLGVAAISALGASLLSTGLVIFAGALLIGDRRTTVVEREMVPRPVASSTAVHDLSGDGIIEVVRRVRPAMALVRVGMGTDTTASAVIFRSDGHLLTSAHALAGFSIIRVVLADGRDLPARLVGTDAASDTAVIKIEGGPFPVATLGAANDLQVGQPAIAFGAPMGNARGTSVSLGVVSGLHRSVRAASGNGMLYDMLQTDAPIAPSCPGGAVVDTLGNVVGMTAHVAPGEDGGAGLGFATPIELAHAMAEQIIEHGSVRGVWIGVEGGDLDGERATELAVDGGAVVDQVTLGGPAQIGGLVPRDVIVAVDGRPIAGMGHLVSILRRHLPGEAVVLDVRRGEQTRTVKLTLAPREKEADPGND